MGNTLSPTPRITSAEIVDATIETADLKDQCVQGGKLGVPSVGQYQLYGDTVHAGHFQAGVISRHYDYLITKRNATFYAYKGVDGSLLYSGALASSVINTVLSQIDTDGGGSLFIKAGTYLITASLVIYSNTIIEGEGENTLLYLGNGVNLEIISATSKDNITIRNLMIDGNKANNPTPKHGILLTTCDNAIISHVTVHDAKFDGIRLDACDNALIEFCTAYDNFVVGINLEDICSHCRIVSCLAYNNINTNIHLWGDAGNIGLYNLVINCITYGSGAGYSNILAEYQDYCGINNCIAYSSGLSGAMGIDFTNTKYSSIIGCLCYDNASGISIEGAGSYENTVSGCVCRDNEFFGIVLSGGALKCTISGCVCEGNDQNGIMLLANAGKCAIIGCVCRNQVQYDGVNMDGSDDCVVVGNCLQDNGRYGIYAYNTADYNVFVANNLRGNTTAPTSITGTGNVEEHNI